MPEFEDLPLHTPSRVYGAALVSRVKGDNVLTELIEAGEIRPTETGTRRTLLTTRDARVLWLALTKH